MFDLLLIFCDLLWNVLEPHLSGYINPAVVTVFIRLIHTTYSPVLYSGSSNKLFNYYGYHDYRTTTTTGDQQLEATTEGQPQWTLTLSVLSSMHK